MPSAEIAMIAVSTGVQMMAAKKEDDFNQASLAMQRAAMEDEDNMAAIQAMQAEVEKREERRALLSQQQAALAAKGRTTTGTGGTKAIKQATLGFADRAIKNIRLNRQFQKRRFQLAQADNRLQSKASKTARNFKMVNAALSGGRSLMAI